MASPNRPRRRNSKDDPPDLAHEIVRLRREFIELYDRDHLELMNCIDTLRRLFNAFEGYFRSATEVSRYTGLLGIAGGVTVIAGLALAPFTLGASAVVGSAGAGMALGCGIGSGILNFKKMNQQKKIRQNVENRLKEFQIKIIPMTDILKVICDRTNEILRDLNKPEHVISGFSKCCAGVSEVLRIMRIDDIGEEAAQMSKTEHLTTTLSGIFAGISLVLDILSVIEDNKALNDMDNLARNRRIDETEIESKAGKFIVDMRKIICDLQKVMDDLQETRRRY